MEVKHIQGTMILEQAIHKDDRGYFRELYKISTFFQIFKQDNTSFSKANVIRGLHFQEKPFAQAKYITVISGKIIDIIVDIRKNSPTFGNYMRIELSAENGRVVYMPEGIAHGFAAIEDSNIIYKCNNEYNPKAEKCILYNDVDLNIDWGIENPIVAEKDLKGLKFSELFSLDK